MQSFRKLITLTLILLAGLELHSLIAAYSAHAGEFYEFKHSSIFPEEDNFRAFVTNFQPGDRIKIVLSQKTLLDIKLGSFLGEGCFGRVFLIDEQPLTRVIKFQFDKFAATQMMQKEVYALTSLNRIGIPHSKILEYSPNFYLIKEYVPGETFEKIACSTWKNLEPDSQAILVIELNKIRRSLRSNKISVADLHQENLIFDIQALTWKIIDASGIGSHLDDPLFDLEYSISIHPELETAYNWIIQSRRFEVCIKPYFFLKKVESIYKSGRTSEAFSLFSKDGPDRISELLDHCPSEFSELWNKLSVQMAG
jgi:hypothetical protein